MSLGQPQQKKTKGNKLKKNLQKADYKLTKINEKKTMPWNTGIFFGGGGGGRVGGGKIYLFVKVLPSNLLLVFTLKFLNTGGFKYGSYSGHFLY